MSGTDDLVDLFQPPDDPSTFRQGRLLTFDKNTGANTVSLSGAVLTNLPLLNIGDTVNLQGDDVLGPGNGNVVILMKYGAAYAILGRVVTVGSTILNSTAIETKGSNPFSSGGFATTSSLVVQASGIVQVPAWANTASIFAYCWGTANNSTAGVDFFYLQTSLLISGIGGPFGGAVINSASVPAGAWAFAFAGGSRTGQAVTPGGTVTVQGAVKSNSAWAFNASNLIQVESVMTFYKT
jgi:hypothetical protein